MAVRWSDETRTVLLVELEPDEELKKLATEALEVQDACNLCGLAQRFGEVMIALNRHPQNTLGTEWVNQHPITRVWLDKFCSLARLEQDRRSRSYQNCWDLQFDIKTSFEVRSSSLDYWLEKNLEVATWV